MVNLRFYKSIRPEIKFRKGKREFAAPLFHINDSVIGLLESEMVEPNPLRVFDGEVIPVVPFITTLPEIIPFPELGKAQIPDHDILGAVDLKARVLDCAAGFRINDEPFAIPIRMRPTPVSCKIGWQAEALLPIDGA